MSIGIGTSAFFLQTIENTREKDETLVQPEDEEVIADEAEDEFAGLHCNIQNLASLHHKLRLNMQPPDEVRFLSKSMSLCGRIFLHDATSGSKARASLCRLF